MAISINWATKVIYIPKDYLTLVQSSPSEILELNLNTLRLDLKAIEDSDDGMPMDDTHRHYPPVPVGGIELARVVEIINGYTVTFEDGQYAVNLKGANTNLGDVVNVNQVSVRSANSAGLVNSAALEFGEFGGAVTVDVVNGVPGTTYPAGTKRVPVNNLTDAIAIADHRRFKRIELIGSLTIKPTDNISHFEVVGQTPIHSLITIEDNPSASYTLFKNCTLTGSLDNNNTVEASRVYNISVANGYLKDCLVQEGYIKISGDQDVHMVDCWTDAIDGRPILDFNGTTNSAILHGWAGDLCIANMSEDTSKAVVNIKSGTVEIDDTVTAGTIVLKGVGSYTHNQSGTEVVDTEGLIDNSSIAESVWLKDISGAIEGSAADTLLHTAYRGSIYIDTIAGEDGSDFPYGLYQRPVKTISSAIALASKYSLNSISVKGTATVSSDDDISGIVFSSDSSSNNSIIVSAGALTEGAVFTGVTVSGTLDGAVSINKCNVVDLVDFDGNIKDSVIMGTVSVKDSKHPHLIDCAFYVTQSSDSILVDTGTGDITISGAVGSLGITNKSSTGETLIGMNQGKVRIMDTCSAGSVIIYGVPERAVLDESGDSCSVEVVTDNNIFARKVDIYPLY